MSVSVRSGLPLFERSGLTRAGGDGWWRGGEGIRPGDHFDEDSSQPTQSLVVGSLVLWYKIPPIPLAAVPCQGPTAVSPLDHLHTSELGLSRRAEFRSIA